MTSSTQNTVLCVMSMHSCSSSMSSTSLSLFMDIGLLGWVTLVCVRVWARVCVCANRQNPFVVAWSNTMDSSVCLRNTQRQQTSQSRCPRTRFQKPSWWCCSCSSAPWLWTEPSIWKSPCWENAFSRWFWCLASTSGCSSFSLESQRGHWHRLHL